MPPLIIVGSNFVFSKIELTKDVVVVLPWEPTTTIFFIKETRFANIFPLLITGNFFLLASSNSGLLFFIAEEVTTIVTSFIFCFF